MKNLSFEDGWETLPVTGNAGWLQNQRPNHWQLTILPPGATLWDSTDKATGEPEAVHKLAHQLPPNEQPGGSDPLILDGETVYKVFHSGAAYGVELRQTVEGLKPGSGATAVVWVRIHDHKGTDPYGAEFRMMTNGKGDWWHKASGQLANFKWAKRSQSRTIGEDGRFELVIQLKTKYSLPVDWFLDGFEFTGEYADTEPPVDPPPDPPPTDHDHPEIDEQLDSLQTQYDALAVFVASLDERLTAVENGQTQPPQQLITLPARALAVDVSANNGVFNWNKAKESGVEYAVIRSSNGLGSTTTDNNGRDLQLFRNALECTRLGIPFSIYHYLQPSGTTSQAGLVNAIRAELIQFGTPPTGAALTNGRVLPPVWCDVESFDLNITSIELFCEILDCGIYTSAYYWDGIAGNTAAWWADYPLWAAHWTGNNNGQVPPGTAVPILPHDFNQADLWQFTSKGGALVGWPGGLDVNLTGPFTAVAPPPTGETYAIDFLRADPQAWRVIRRADGSGEDVWDLPTSTGFCRVKNSQQGEWYSADGRTRHRDTSPAPDSTGKARLYVQTTGGTSGGKIAPDTAIMGKIYTFYSDVQFYAKSNCQPLDENSGQNVPSTFQLVDVIDDYEFPMTGFVVDRLYITMQTGEKQLYAIKDGRKIGWVGGGASQAGNTWAGELNELYFDRNIPQLEPNKYCS